MDYLLLVCYLVILGFIVALFVTGRSIAPWVPMYKKDLGRLAKITDLKAGECFMEVGSGDGRVSHFIASNFPDVKVVGIEYYYPMFLVSMLRATLAPRKNLKFVYGNALNMDFSSADVVYTYALPNSLNEKLLPKLQQELKKGSRLVSYIFTIKEWAGEVVEDKPGEKEAGIYTYIF